MKKLQVLLILLMTSGIVLAQKGKISAAASALSSGKLDKAIENINIAVENPATATNPKAYFVKGEIYQQIAESTEDVLKLMKVSKIENAAVIAFESYEKALEYDKKGKFKKKVKEKMKKMPTAFSMLGAKKYEENNFEKAAEFFLKAGQLNEEYNSLKDTSTYFNVALSAERAEKYDMAEMYYSRLLKEFNYKPAQMYAKIAGVLKQKGDLEASNQLIKEGFEKFPQNIPLLYEIINYYMASKESDKALKYLDKAIQINPKNPTLYHAKAQLFTETGDYAKAEEIIMQALKIKPGDFDSMYRLAFLKSQAASDKYKLAQEIMDNTRYKQEMKNVYAQFNECVPYFENALAVKPDNRDLLNALKEITFLLRNESPEMMKKYEGLKEKLENM